MSIQPQVFTPNGDGAGDVAEIRFTVLKVDLPPRVRIYSLNGELVNELQGERLSNSFWGFDWSGQDQSGKQVLPGNYLCHISLDAQVGDEKVVRVISVAY